MARTIGSLTGDLVVGPDVIFDAQALLSSGTVTSSAFKLGESQSSIALKVFANTEITIAATKSIVIALTSSDTEGGSYTAEKTLATYTPATIAAGTELVNFVPGDDIKPWCKLTVTTDDDQTADKVDAYLTMISR